MNLNEITTTQFAAGAGTNCIENIKNYLADEMGLNCTLSEDGLSIIVTVTESLKFTVTFASSNGNTGAIQYSVSINGTEKAKISGTATTGSILYLTVIKKSDSEYAIGIDRGTSVLSVIAGTATTVDKSQTVPCIVLHYQGSLFCICDGMTGDAGNMSRNYLSDYNILQLTSLTSKGTKFICSNIYIQTVGGIIQTGKHQVGGKTFASTTGTSGYPAVFLKID